MLPNSISHGDSPTFRGSLRRLQLLKFALMAICLTACADSGDSVVTSCVLPTDQAATLSGYWQVKPVPIAFHQGDWSSTEVGAMTSAADTWNNFFAASQSFQILDYGGSSPRVTAASKPSDPCNNGLISGGKFTAPVGIYKDSTWPYSSSLIALTTFCTQTTGVYGPMFSAVMEINYQNYFVSGMPNPDLQSIVLHELGHVNGLNHSCEVSKANFPVCSTAPAAYQSASMEPVFNFDSSGNGIQKQTLNSNDEGRANCLYDGTYK